MKKLSTTFFALLFVAAIYSSANAASTVPMVDATAQVPPPPLAVPATIDNRPQGWNSSERFEISDVYGLQEAYNAEEPIVFYVEGKSDKLNVEKENGFYVAASLDIPSENTTIIGNVAYDSVRHAWQVNLTAPKDNTKQYEISVHLLCGVNDSPCATSYGAGAKIDKILPLQIR